MATAFADRDEQRRANQRLQRRRFRQRYHEGHSSGLTTVNVTVPDDVQRVEESAPCFKCGVRGGCHHRPWMLGA